MMIRGAMTALEMLENEPPDDRGSTSETGGEGAPSGRARESRRVLVVEDDYLVGLTICDLLSGSGYEVLGPAVSAEEAIGLALEERPHLVLMDIRLAGEMDGVDAAVALARAGIRSLFVSAHSDPTTRSRGQEASPLGWVEKPFSDAQLLEAVAAALG
jgi:two-component system, response regulator PdtaR